MKISLMGAACALVLLAHRRLWRRPPTMPSWVPTTPRRRPRSGGPGGRLQGQGRPGPSAGRDPQVAHRRHLPGKGIREISLKAKEDQPIVLNLALAWRLTGDRAYLDQAGRYLEAWADIYEPSFNPIDETGFDTLLMAYDLTEADLPAATRAKVDKLWRGMASGYLDAMDAKPKNFNTNWQSHRSSWRPWRRSRPATPS